MKNKKNNFIFLFVCLANFLMGQISGPDGVKIPFESIGQKFYIAKYEAISPVEIYKIVDDNFLMENDEILDNINAYNLIIFRKLNNYISETYEKYKDSSVIMLHSRDIEENENNDVRFVIKSVIRKDDIISGKRTNAFREFYIYDEKFNTYYETFPSLESLLRALKKTNNFYKNTPTAELSQAKVNKFAPGSKTKGKSGGGRSNTGGVILMLVAFFVGIPVAAFLIG